MTRPRAFKRPSKSQICGINAASPPANRARLEARVPALELVADPAGPAKLRAFDAARAADDALLARGQRVVELEPRRTRRGAGLACLRSTSTDAATSVLSELSIIRARGARAETCLLSRGGSRGDEVAGAERPPVQLARG